ncbi:hypothetical protein OsI_24221 [Oryza sativa Indica Group]|uniref:Uncharacterized protein n=1 Tax=Oryza sativa subsp. indica TaxID=39946 RepID=A2YGC0_ORYSI|nr:hypothetical protein OsI_24221 [Oryza sativa Indica Group]
MATIPGLLICLLMILPVLSTNRSERGGAELVHRSNWVRPLNRAAVDSEAVHVLPGDERLVFYLARTMSAAGAPTTGVDVYCPGFQPKKDASTRPGDVIPSISELNGTRQYIAKYSRLAN